MYASTLKFIKNQIHNEQIYVNESARKGNERKARNQSEKNRHTCSMQSSLQYNEDKVRTVSTITATAAATTLAVQKKNQQKCNIDVLQAKKLKSKRRTEETETLNHRIKHTYTKTTVKKRNALT